MGMPTWMKKWKEWEESKPAPYRVETGRGYTDRFAYVYEDRIVVNGAHFTEQEALGLADWIYATLERKRN